MTQAASAHHFPRVCVGDGKCVQRSAGPMGAGQCDEIKRRVNCVIFICPGHPGFEFSERLAHSLVQGAFIPKLKRTQGNDAIGKCDEWEHGREFDR